MFRSVSLIRLMAVLACLVWGVAELWALQRARWQQNRFGH